MSELNRCWIGFPLPSELKAKVAEAQMAVRKRAGSDAIRWHPIGEVGLLLVSLGEIGHTTVLRVEGMIQQVAKNHGPISLTLDGVGGSPSMTMPKSAWIGLGGEVEKLKALRRDLAQAVVQLRTAVDEKEFEPVVEIGLLRKFDDRARTEMGRSLKMAQVGLLGGFTMGSVHVLASRASTSGPYLASMSELALAE
jgi:2'-5' RNA ligase